MNCFGGKTEIFIFIQVICSLKSPVKISDSNLPENGETVKNNFKDDQREWLSDAEHFLSEDEEYRSDNTKPRP